MGEFFSGTDMVFESGKDIFNRTASDKWSVIQYVEGERFMTNFSCDKTRNVIPKERDLDVPLPG